MDSSSVGDQGRPVVSEICMGGLEVKDSNGLDGWRTGKEVSECTSAAVILSKERRWEGEGDRMVLAM